MLGYHDTEWGNPVHDDRKWFEFIVLDAFQATIVYAFLQAAGMVNDHLTHCFRYRELGG
jgi:3-methyladenine DNA glycosylase Tag